jgi:hypothetical protein
MKLVHLALHLTDLLLLSVARGLGRLSVLDQTALAFDLTVLSGTQRTTRLDLLDKVLQIFTAHHQQTLTTESDLRDISRSGGSLGFL